MNEIDTAILDLIFEADLDDRNVADTPWCNDPLCIAGYWCPECNGSEAVEDSNE